MFVPLRSALRSWNTARGTALLAMLALALGIGSATAIYSVAEAVLLKPLPYREARRYVAFYGAQSSDPAGYSALSYNNLREFAQEQHSFDLFGWFTPSDFNLTFAGNPEHVHGVRVTPWLARGLGVQPRIGRWFARDTDSETVISDRLWHTLGARPDILGKSIRLDGKSYTVSGVMPAWFRLPLADPSGGPLRSDLWIPLDPRYEQANLTQGYYFCYARRKPGVTLAQARADARRMAAEYARAHPDDHSLDSAKLESLRDVVSHNFRPTLILLIAATALLLLIACANVSGLLVTRAVARTRETAIRLAMGAARRQILSQFFNEGLIVALVGAACGMVLSILLVRVIVSLGSDIIAQAEQISIDSTALVFASAIAFAVSLLASFAPLGHALRTAPAEVLSDGARASTSARSRRLSQVLVVGEIALTFTLLAAAALLIAQLSLLNRADPGFDPRGLYTFQLSYGDPSRLAEYQQSVLSALTNTAGVQGATLSNQLPLNGCCLSTTIFPEGAPDRYDSKRVAYLPVSPDYFSVMRIPILAGRAVTARDTNEQTVNVVINQAAARHYWPHQNALGAYGHFLNPKGSRFRVVGISHDVRNDGLRNPTVPSVALLSALSPPNPAYYVVRSSMPEQALLPALRASIRRLNPEQPIYDVRPYHEILATSLTFESAASLLTGFFALAAVLLSVLGIYGVVAYSVRQRTVELGTRLALGADQSDLWKLILGSGLKMATAGLVIGSIAVAAATIALVRSSVVQSVAPWPFVSSIAIVAGVAFAGSLYPAWRAAQLSPMVAIRDDPASLWATLRERFRQFPDSAPATSQAPALTELVEAARHAGSPQDALELALATLCDALPARQALLFEYAGAVNLRLAAAYPATGSPLSFPAGFLLKRFRFYRSALPISEADLDVWSRWAAAHKPEYTAEIEALRRLEIRLAAPLKTKKETIGLLLLGETTARQLRGWPDLLALMLENARLTRRTIEQEKLNRDLALAAEVQKRLLPEGLPQSAAGDLAAFTLPARSVGGDYYDFLRVGDHELGIALADVAGKGVPAALIMSVVQASLRVLADEAQLSLPQLVAKMNRFLHRSTGVSSYATFFYAQVDEATRRLRYVNAGHNPPLLLRAQTTAPPEELAAGGMIIGMFPQADYSESHIELQPGDVLLAFTDGVTEALNTAEEEFGEERLKDILRAVAHLPVQEMVQRIGGSLKEWIGTAPQHDDLTFLILKVR